MAIVGTFVGDPVGNPLGDAVATTLEYGKDNNNTQYLQMLRDRRCPCDFEIKED